MGIRVTGQYERIEEEMRESENDGRIEMRRKHQPSRKMEFSGEEEEKKA